MPLPSQLCDGNIWQSLKQFSPSHPEAQSGEAQAVSMQELLARAGEA
jgi:hypothetical protein